MPPTGEPRQVQVHRKWLQGDSAGGWHAGAGQGLGAHLHWLLHAGTLQVWLLWGLQDLLQWHAGRGEVSCPLQACWTNECQLDLVVKCCELSFFCKVFLLLSVLYLESSVPLNYCANLPAGEHILVEDIPLPGGFCQRRVLRRHCPGPHGGSQGPHPDPARLRQHPQRVRPQDVRRGGHLGVSLTPLPTITLWESY